MAELFKLSAIGECDARGPARTRPRRSRGEFPYPRELWMCGNYDCLAEREAWLLTPVEAEARYARELARLAEVEIHCRVGMAESMPFEPGFFDAIYSGGCAHHFQTEKAFPEIARVLVPGGRFAAEDPWRAPFYGWGIRVFGKREKEVHCRPLDAGRLAPLRESFCKFSVIQHGTFTRYPMLALRKLGVATPYRLAWKLTEFDDALASLVRLRGFGSSVAILAETNGAPLPERCESR